MATGLMLASKISGIVDDDGTGTTGTVIDKLWMQQLDAGDTINVNGPINVQYNGTERAEFFTSSNQARILTGHAFDNDTSEGCHIFLGRNNDASTPAAGFLALEDKGGTTYYVHVDDSGVLRVGTTVPDNSNDTTNTVVGTQT